MALDFSVFEKHPYYTGGAVIVAGVAVWYFFLRGSSGSVAAAPAVTSAPAPGTTDADYQQAMQIGAQFQLAQLQAQTQLAAQSQQLDVTAQQNAYNFSLGQQQLTDQATATNDQFKLQEDTLQTQAAMQSAALANQLAEQQAGYQASLQGLTISSNAAITQSKISANSAISQETIAANLQQNLAAIQAGVMNNQISAESQDLQAQLNTQAIINGQNTSEAAHESNNSLFGSIAGGLIGAFL